MEKVIQLLRAEIEKRQAALDALISLGYSDSEGVEESLQSKKRMGRPKASGLYSGDIYQSIRNVFLNEHKNTLLVRDICHQLRNYHASSNVRHYLNNHTNHFKRIGFGEYELIDEPQVVSGRGATEAVIKVLSRSKKPLSTAQITEKLGGQYSKQNVMSALSTAIQAGKYFKWVARGVYQMKDAPIDSEASTPKASNLMDSVKAVLKQNAREMTVDEIANELSAQYTHRQVQSLLYCTEAKKYFKRVGKGTYILKGVKPFKVTESADQVVSSDSQRTGITDAIRALLRENGPMRKSDIIAQLPRGKYTDSNVSDILTRLFKRVAFNTYDLISSQELPVRSATRQPESATRNLIERIKEHILNSSEKSLSLPELLEQLGDVQKTQLANVLYGYAHRGQHFKSGETRDGRKTFTVIED